MMIVLYLCKLQVFNTEVDFSSPGFSSNTTPLKEGTEQQPQYYVVLTWKWTHCVLSKQHDIVGLLLIIA